MCGIAGIMTRDGTSPDTDILSSLLNGLAHRGPDGVGRHIGGSVGLVQTRLAIIDLESGDHPLYDATGTALVGNGEIYNYVELRAEIGESRFATKSDFEPPLLLYRHHGLNFADHLRGMYAIALHDPADDGLILARDPFGIKPLYFVETDTVFAFASEPQALIGAGIADREICDDSVKELLQLQFTTGAQTPFAKVNRVLPGETLLIRQGRVVDRRRRPALPQSTARFPLSEVAAVSELDTVLADCVTVHQRSDVDYAMFLSGGVDSTALLAMMTRLNPQPVTAYTTGFNEGVDERHHARNVAKALGARHVEVDFGERDFWQLLPRVAAAVDDPAADYALLPTFKLAQVAAEEVKVVLCGEGGDELFGGYGRYRSVMRPWIFGGRVMRHKGIFDGTGLLTRPLQGWRDGIAASEHQESRAGRSRLAVAQAVDCADWLPNDLLVKLDRCLMAHSLEGRTPFLDPRMAAFAFSLPDRLKIRKGAGKYLLKAWLNRILPMAEPFNPKRGFTVPVGRWIADKGPRLGPLLARQPAIAAMAKPESIENLTRHCTDKRAGFAAWTLLYYALWHRRHILGLMPEGDVFDCLSTTPGA